jgi:hypothetical protein
MKYVVIVLSVFLSGCFSAKPEAVVSEHKQRVCVEETSCKKALAEDCTKGGVIYGIVPAIVVEYSCNPQ